MIVLHEDQPDEPADPWECEWAVTVWKRQGVDV